MKITIPETLHCERCGHTWVPRKIEVKICPRCKSKYWNQPRPDDSDHLARGVHRRV